MRSKNPWVEKVREWLDQLINIPVFGEPIPVPVKEQPESENSGSSPY